MLNSDTRAWIEIDLSRIAHNIKEVQKLLPSTNKIMAIVKANAYGHGDVVCARELERLGIDFFGVSSVDEGITLREAGIKQPILILGYTPPIHFHYVVEYGLLQTFLSYAYACKANAYAQEHNVVMKGHIKVDTGMSRIGIVAQDNDYHIDDIKAIYQMEHLQVSGIFSHFSVSDGLSDDHIAYTNYQIQMFERVLKDLKDAGIEAGTRHLQNSYGILNYPVLDYDYARPGLLWMGVTSDDSIAIKTKPNFQQVMEFKTNITLVKQIKEGVCVSYGRHYTATSPRMIASLAVGYADGYPRIASNTGFYVLIHGQKAMIVGNICMDQMMVDVTGIAGVKEGDVATLFGYDGDAFLSIDELSRHSGTINNETFCKISARVPRIYK